jgi:hypothetical protein
MTAMWRELVSGLTTEATFHPPASENAIRAAEQTLSQKFHPDLVELLLETDGIDDEYGFGLVWNVDRIVQDNLNFRTFADFQELYMPFEPLLFFADAGNGDQFAFLSPPVDRDDIFAWDHEDDTRKWVAARLEMYLRWWIGGQIKL